MSTHPTNDPEALALAALAATLSDERRARRFLDLTGLEVDELRERDLFVTYEYPSSAKFRKPLTLAGGLLVVFALSWVVGNLDVSIGKKQKQKTI